MAFGARVRSGKWKCLVLRRLRIEETAAARRAAPPMYELLARQNRTYHTRLRLKRTQEQEEKRYHYSVRARPISKEKLY